MDRNQWPEWTGIRTELKYIAQQFGIPPPGVLRVFLFAGREQVSRQIATQSGALALANFDTIVICSDHQYMVETVRHELAHVFAQRLAWWPPPLLSEGLACWLQGTYHGKEIDEAVVPHLLTAEFNVTALLARRFFYSDHRSSCYPIAASFTGFLIRTYGWERYKDLYRRAVAINFKSQFERIFGTTFRAAESEWRKQISQQYGKPLTDQN
jgi:hypothetical protein